MTREERERLETLARATCKRAVRIAQDVADNALIRGESLDLIDERYRTSIHAAYDKLRYAQWTITCAYREENTGKRGK